MVHVRLDRRWRDGEFDSDLGVGEPLTEQADDLIYIEGFGLCAADFLARSQALLDGETERNAGRLDLGILGRKLRTLVGRNEGLHALIAHLSGELQAAA